MQLENLVAVAHPAGHRIDLSWQNPEAAAFPGARVVRRDGTHPTSPDPAPGEGRVVADTSPGSPDQAQVGVTAEGTYRVEDRSGLAAETVYYYAVYPYSGDPPAYDVDLGNRTAAMATGRYGFAEHMYGLLPAIYHRYDTRLPADPPPEMSPADHQRGQLRRFLDLPGGELDRLHSCARALAHLYDLDRVDGRLLPLLAQWIGWKTDFRLELDAQRNELRNAPALYRTVGLIPTVAATVKRISGWESRAKEFVHNVFASNRPERLNLWTRPLADGEASADAVLSLDFAYEGRPAEARDAQGVRWLFYHTRKGERWQVWAKTSPSFRLAPDLRSELADGATVSEALRQALIDAGVGLAADATVSGAGDLWRIEDATSSESYAVVAGPLGLTVYHTTAPPTDWSPSFPAGEGGELEKDPTAVLLDQRLWLAWSAYDPASRRWRVRYRWRQGGVWSSTQTFAHGSLDPETERREARVVVDRESRLWVLWLEKAAGRWQLRYNRLVGGGFALNPPASFPLDSGAAPRVEDDLFALAPADPAGPALFLFWARREAAGGVQSRWSVVFRTKATLDPAVSDWSEIRSLPKGDPDSHDREPAAVVVEGGILAVYFSSSRGGSWSVWRADLDPATMVWNAAAPVTGPPYSERAPLPLADGDSPLLVYRSNRSLTYTSQVYGALETLDGRYAGATTADVRNTEKLALRGELEDFGTYSYDTGATDNDWYRRDTLGLYLAPDTVDPEKVERGVSRLRPVLREFLPLTDRAVLIARPDVHTEAVYTYDLPGAEESRIAESWADLLTSPLTDGGLGPGEDFSDELEP